MFRRFFILAGICFVLAACASKPHNLPQETIQSLGISEIDVNLDKAFISWGPEEERISRQPRHSPEPRTDAEVQAMVVTKLQKIIHDEYSRVMKSAFRGPRQARMTINVRTMSVPSLAKRVFIDNVARFTTDITITDIKTGELLARDDKVYEHRQMLGGVLAPLTDAVGLVGSDPAVEIIQSQAYSVRKWLSQVGN